MKFKILLTCLTFSLLGGCAFNAETLGRAFGVHQSFPTLSMSVQECVAPYPAVRARIVSPFNVLVDKWEIARDKTTEQLLMESAAALRHMQEIRTAWSSIKVTLVEEGIDCGPAVLAMVSNAESTFDDVYAGLLSNQRVLTWLEIGNMISNVAAGRGGKVVRMS